MKYTQYNHHGETVWVKTEQKGRHKEHCLCYACEKFHPGSEDNCPVAEANYRHCVEYNLVLPVWECPWFMERE